MYEGKAWRVRDELEMVKHGLRWEYWAVFYKGNVSKRQSERSCNPSLGGKEKLDGADKAKMSDACYGLLFTRKASWLSRGEVRVEDRLKQ